MDQMKLFFSCIRKYSIRSDFFSGSRLPLFSKMTLLLVFCNKCGDKKPVNFLNLPRRHLLIGLPFAGKFVHKKILSLDLKFGGPGKIADIDETSHTFGKKKIM